MQLFDDAWRAFIEGRCTLIQTCPGVLLSWGSAGILEAHLVSHGRMWVPHALVSVF